jgi:succinate-semialdehyde dehydrogenase/glutarate-semialdehyde dehydrogenase
VGPLIDQPAFDKVSHHVGDAVDHGARLLMGGRPHDRGRTFYQPTILDGLSADCAIWHEETFGPVAAVRTFATECEAIELANDTPYGLAAYMYSRDIGRIFRVSERLETGILGINTGFISVEVAPFGGVKESGIGREGSKYGVEDWIETRYLSLGGIEP